METYEAIKVPASDKVKPFQVRDLLVAIGLGIIDDPLLKYLDFFSSKVPVASAYFLHVLPKFDLFYNMYEETASGLISNYELNAEVIETMRTKLNVHPLKEHVLRLEFDVREGNPLEELLQDANALQSDLVVIGQRKGKVEHGILARNLVRKVKGNAIILPEEAPLRLRSVMVPIDFSPNSVKALRIALALKERIGEDLTITCVNVYDMPNLSIYKVQKTFEQLKKMVQADRKEAFKNFLNKYAEGYADQIQTALIEHSNPGIAHFLADYADNHETDMIIIGAKGHSKVERLLLGSVTERLCAMDLQIPIMVVKE